jgi:hypothetical protein
MSKHTSPFPPNGLGKQEIHLLYWANDLRVKLVIGWKDPLDRGAYHVCFSCHSAFFPLLTRVISVPVALTISTDH